MPRVDNLGKNVSEWNRKTGEGSSTWDVCADCYTELLHDPHVHDDVLTPYGREEPAGTFGRSGDVAHPHYDEGDFYKCAICGETLLEERDGDGYEIAKRRKLLDQYNEGNAA